MSESSYNIEDASVGITDMGLEQADRSESSRNNVCSQDSKSSQKPGMDERKNIKTGPSNRQNVKNDNRKNSRNYRMTKRQQDESRSNTRDKSTRNLENQHARKFNINAAQCAEVSNDQLQFCEGEPRSNTRDKTTKKQNKKPIRTSYSHEKQHAEGTTDPQKGCLRTSHTNAEDCSSSCGNEPRSNKRDNNRQDQNDSRRSFERNYKREVFINISDEEMNKFLSYLDSKQANNFKKIQEEERDLFKVGNDYALAHCVAEDMNMGSGIAVEFRFLFGKVPQLLDQNIGIGGLATLKIGDRFIYYLVTKKRSQGKPTYDSLWASLIELRKHMKINEVEKLALPRIGCGLDRLDWNIVKPMLEFIFRDENFSILVCNLQLEGSTTTKKIVKKCKVIYETKQVTEIEPGTIIIYFASKDGRHTEAMEMLDKKFNIANFFQRAPKNIGETIRLVPTRPKNYILYGCIVKNKYDDNFDFIAFEKCLRAIKKNYKTDNLFYIAFQKMSDDLQNAKILIVMKHTLRDIDIHTCGWSDPYSNVEE